MTPGRHLWFAFLFHFFLYFMKQFSLIFSFQSKDLEELRMTSLLQEESVILCQKVVRIFLVYGVRYSHYSVS